MQSNEILEDTNLARNIENLNKTRDEIKIKTGTAVEVHSVDVKDEKNVKETVDKVVEKNGNIDILVNNAGTSSAHPVMNITDQIMNDDLGTKLFGAIYMIQAVVPSMKKNGNGSIVNITTPGGKASGANTVPTSVSRAAGISLTKAISKELCEFNIRVNTVCVGLFKSGQHRKRYESRVKDEPSLTIDEFYNQLGESVPLGKRVGEAEEAAALITFLSSDLSSYTTGTAVNVDGGVSPVV